MVWGTNKQNTGILRIYLKNPGCCLEITISSSIVPHILPHTSIQYSDSVKLERELPEWSTKNTLSLDSLEIFGNSREVLGNLWFPSGLPETWVQAKLPASATHTEGRQDGRPYLPPT